MKPLKLSVAVCEYNPFHNGHKLHLDRMREQSPDAVAVIMSGNFCQRGEAALLDKYTRARHAVLNGADIVFELPTVFSVAPAEVFASGAVKLLDSLYGEKTLYFGTETGRQEDFLKVSSLLLNETAELKQSLKNKLNKGLPYAQARFEAYKDTYPDCDFSVLTNPNGILGIEYCKAILKSGSKIKVQPILRNTDYNGTALDGNFASALAIREAISDGKRKKTKNFFPENVYGDLPDKIPCFDDLMLYGVLRSDKRGLREVLDCTEGLENRLKALVPFCKNMEEFMQKLETRRYTRARLRRIITANMLGITKDFTLKCLKSNLYLKVLAIASDKVNLLSAFSGCKNKLVTRKSDTDNFSVTQKLCFAKDVYANDVYNLIAKKHTNEFEMQIVKRQQK